jgi:hypothetical protein
MPAVLRPHTTNEGWNTWPTEKVSHTLVNDPRVRGDAEGLRESLVAFALSRVDWMQLAEAEIAAAIPEDEVHLAGIAA